MALHEVIVEISVCLHRILFQLLTGSLDREQVHLGEVKVENYLFKAFRPICTFSLYKRA